MKEEILSIASDLRDGSMTTNEAKEQLLVLFGVVGSYCKKFEENFNGSSYCKKCGHHIQDH